MKLLLVITMISCWSFEVGSTSLIIWNQKFLCKTALFFRRKVFNLPLSLSLMYIYMCVEGGISMVYMSLEIWISKFIMCPRVVDESSNELWHKTTFVLST